MGRKCSVAQCRSGYAKVKTADQQRKVSVYGFPCNEEERKEWLERIPNKFDTVTQNMGVCALHWPPDTHLVHKRPVVPPSIFSLISYSFPVSRARKPPQCSTTQKTTSGVPDTAFSNYRIFKKWDRLKAETFVNDFKKRYWSAGLFASSEEYVAIFSSDRTGSVHKFTFYVTLHERSKPSKFYVSYEAYHELKQVFHPSLQNPLKYWSELEELLSFLHKLSPSDDTLQLEVISGSQTGNKCSSPENSPKPTSGDANLPSSKCISSEVLCKELQTQSEILPLLAFKEIQYGVNSAEGADRKGEESEMSQNLNFSEDPKVMNFKINVKIVS